MTSAHGSLSTDAGVEQWTFADADELSDVIVAALAANDIDTLFFSSGWEIAFLQEAIAKARARGKKAPRIITMTHEHAGLNAALGYAAVTGRPAATAVHVDAGTFNQGAAIHSAWYSGLPVLTIAGGAPTSYPDGSRVARDSGGHIWMQHPRDQNGIVRDYTKWDHRLEAHDNAGLIISRALQVARTEPAGPVYLTIPKELGFAPSSGERFPTAEVLGIPRPPAPAPSGIWELADRLTSALHPVFVVAASGRNPATVEPLVELCEMLGIAVVHAAPRPYLSFPMVHPLNATEDIFARADVVVALEAGIPWIPGRAQPNSSAYIATIDCDPIHSRIPLYEFTANLRLASDPLEAIAALKVACEARRTESTQAAAQARSRTLAVEFARRRADLDARVQSLRSIDRIDPLVLGSELAQRIDDNCIIFDETIAPTLRPFLKLSRPGSYFNLPASSGGWSPGAALGAKLARPDRDVVAVTGDGFYMYSTANAALWSARHYKAPYLTVVYQNRSYSTGTSRLAYSYPDSYGVAAGCEGGYFDPPLDFEKEAEAAGAYGENVRDPANLAAAFDRGFERIRNGQAAVISVWLPRLLHET